MEARNTAWPNEIQISEARSSVIWSTWENDGKHILTVVGNEARYVLVVPHEQSAFCNLYFRGITLVSKLCAWILGTWKWGLPIEVDICLKRGLRTISNSSGWVNSSNSSSSFKKRSSLLLFTAGQTFSNPTAILVHSIDSM